MMKKAGEYKLNKIELISKRHTVDIKNLNMELSLYNDLFLEFMTGDIMIVDSLNLIKRLPIVGGEELVVEYQDQYENPVVKISFIVWKVSRQEGFTQSNQVYKLHLVSPNWYKSMSMKKYDRLTGKGSSVIKNILNKTEMKVKHNPDFYSDPNDPEIDIYSTGKTPFEVIRKAIYYSHDYDNTPWVFHQTLQGFRYESFKKLINGDIYKEIYLQPTHQEKYETIDKTRIADSHFRLDNQNKVNIDNRGSQRTDNITFSILNKNLHFSDFDYQRDFEKIPTLENEPLDRIDKPEFKTRCYIADDPQIADQANIRTALFTMLEDNIFSLIISGDTNYVPGQILKMDIPSKETLNNGYQHEEDLSGRFIITSSKHYIRKDSYRVTLELMKESINTKM